MKAIVGLMGLALALSLQGAAAMELTSPDLRDGAPIAKEQIYTRCGGANLAPALKWSGAPAGTRSFILTFIDTSVLPSGWSHWIVLNIPASASGLAKGGALPTGAKAIESNFGDLTYAGPCPPSGTGVHAYEFTLYALGSMAPAIVENSSANDLTKGLAALALARATLSGTAVTP
jgi:hypothetical protein